MACNASFKSEISITPTVDNEGNYSFNSTILGDLGANGFSLDNSYNVQIVLTDATTRQVVYNLLLGTGSPAIAIHRDGVSFGKPYDTNEGGPLQVYGKSINTYSSNEIRIGTWIDGKPLYRKTLSFTPTSQTTNIEGIANLDILVKAYGVSTRNNTGKYRNLIPCNYTNWEIFLYDINNNSSVLKYSANQWNAGVSGVVIIYEYTKTTD